MEILKEGKTETLDDGKMEKLKDGTIAFAGRERHFRNPGTPVWRRKSGVMAVRKRRLGGLFTVVGRTDNGRGTDG